MGYNGERASLNQLSNLFRYFEKNVAEDLKDIYNESILQDKKINKKDLRYFYQPKEANKDVPLISFDGGMTTIFQGLMTETCLLKVAGATPPEYSSLEITSKLKEVYFHSFVGKLKFTDARDDEALKLFLKSELNRLLSVDQFLSLLVAFKIDLKEFEEKFLNLVNKWKDKSSLKDTIRELLEWGLIIDFLNENRVKNLDKGLPFLIIKDGNISSNPKAVTISISNKIKELLNGGNDKIPMPLIVGAVKSSRFTGDSPLGRLISRFGQTIPSHSFFRIPQEYEAILDKDFSAQPFDRYFLSLFAGETIFEIQIPNVISKSEPVLEKVLDLVASQVTFRYGGSISTNSYAHEKASISEAEGKVLENKILNELNKEIKDEQ